MCSCYHFRHELSAWSHRTGDSCASRGVWGTFTGSSAREVTCTPTHAHKHTYAPFGGDNNPLSIQGKKIYHCNGTFSVKCHFSNAHGQLTGTGFFAVAPGLVSMVGCVVLCHLHSSGMQQWQPGEWGETTTKYINKTKGRQRKQKRRKKKIQKSAGLWHSTFLKWRLGAESQWVSYRSTEKNNRVGGPGKKRKSRSHTLFRDWWLLSMCSPESVLWKTQLWVQKASCLVCIPPWSMRSTGRATRPWKQNPFPCTKTEPKSNVLNHMHQDRHPDLPKWQCSKGGNPFPSLSFFLPSHYFKVLLPWHTLYTDM